MAALPAAAAVSVSNTSTQVSFGYNFTASAFTRDALTPLANSGSLQQYGSTPGQLGRVSAKWTSTIDQDANFYFLSDIQCIGTCAIGILTTTTLTLTNDGNSDAAMRIDSLILPGHIGVQSSSTGNVAGDYSFSAGAGGTQVTAYSKSGLGIDNGSFSNGTSTLYLDPSTNASNYFSLNGFNYYYEDTGTQLAYDFGATNLNVPVTVAANSSVTVTYDSFLSLLSLDSDCTDLARCSGVQVVFGDPRNSGGTSFDGGVISNIVTRSAFKAFDSSGPTPQSVIDRPFGAIQSGFDLTLASDPLPDPQPAYTPPTYAPSPFATPATVPEAASWAMMILGFGMIGAAIRRAGLDKRAIAL